ncbi:MAG: hypothetical protein P1U68_16690 [Verrucomicrobiales bacterium]|nr:hypothetical protein [Verrucomicrobiales bacterium]
MKKCSLSLALLFAFIVSAQSQDGGSRVLEMLVRGIAHAVTSENGSHIVPPQVPHPPHSDHAHAPKPPQNRTWFQPAPRLQQPRVIRQATPPVQSNNPFAGIYRPPVHHPQAVPPRVVVKPQAPSRAPGTSGFPWFQQQQRDSGHGGHDHRDHGSHQKSSQKKPSRHSSSQHSGHGHSSHSKQKSKPQQKVIAVRSQFQPFAVFQGQQNTTTVRRQVQQAPNQGSIVWLRSR